MRKQGYIGLILVLALLLGACAGQGAEEETAVPTLREEPMTEETGETTEPTEATEATEATELTTEPTVPPHSELYLPGYTAEQILEYFEEVVLDVEYTHGDGDITLVQKWTEPILYRFYGTPTEEDRAVLTELFARLNAVPGFPGIHAAEEEVPENLSLSFLEPEDFREQFADVVYGEDANGATQFWYYTATNEIYTARIGYRTDLDQSIRSSILIEEVINTLGITDTVLREDSIVYQYSDDNMTLSEVDWVILKLLYHPAIQCGMDSSSCAAVIAELYY